MKIMVVQPAKKQEEIKAGAQKEVAKFAWLPVTVDHGKSAVDDQIYRIVWFEPYLSLYTWAPKLDRRQKPYMGWKHTGRKSF